MIKFACPHCKKTLQVKDRLAGRKGQCPNPSCKKMIMVPAQTVSAGPADAGAVDLEALAASTLTETAPKEAAPQTVKFTCYYCDAEVELPADLAGKQAPCPECARIVKVPLLEKTGPRDWRKPEAQIGPSGARRDAQVLEGAWGTESKGTVSRQALVEADVLPEVKVPWTLKQKITLAVGLVVGVGVVGGATYFVRNWLKKGGEASAVASAEAYFSNEAGGLAPETQAALGRALAEYYLRTGLTEAGGERQTKGWQRLQMAWQTASGIADSVEKHEILRDLLRTQMLLARAAPDTDPQQAAQRFVQEANKVLAQAKPGLQRAELVRDLARWAVKNGKEAEVRQVIRQSIQAAAPPATAKPEKPGKPGKPGAVGEAVAQPGVQPVAQAGPAGLDLSEQISCLAILAQELALAGRADTAKRLGQELQRGFHPHHAFPHGLMVLNMLLKQPTAELEKHKDQEAVLLARMEGHARIDNPAAARKILDELQEPTVNRLSALVVLAGILVQKRANDQALVLLRDAAGLAERHPEESGWHQQRIVSLTAAAGDRETAAGFLANFQRMPSPPSPAARNRARLALLTVDLRHKPDEPAAADRLKEFEGGGAAGAGQALAAERIARHNGRISRSEALRWAETLEPAVLRPFAALGAVLGDLPGDLPGDSD